MPTTEQRLSALEAENAHLRAEVAALRPPPASAPQDARPDRATVTALSPLSVFEQPTEAELRELYAIVIKAHPVLHWEPHRLDPIDEPFRCFRNAFHAVGALRRTETINTRISLGYFAEICTTLLRGEKLATDMRASSVVAAVLAHGDIGYLALDRFPYDLGFGLSEHLGEGNERSAWRTVLATRVLRKPMPAPPLKPQARGIIGEWHR